MAPDLSVPVIGWRASATIRCARMAPDDRCGERLEDPLRAKVLPVAGICYGRFAGGLRRSHAGVYDSER